MAMPNANARLTAADHVGEPAVRALLLPRVSLLLVGGKTDLVGINFHHSENSSTH